MLLILAVFLDCHFEGDVGQFANVESKVQRVLDSDINHLAPTLLLDLVQVYFLVTNSELIQPLSKYNKVFH